VRNWNSWRRENIWTVYVWTVNVWVENVWTTNVWHKNVWSANECNIRMIRCWMPYAVWRRWKRIFRRTTKQSLQNYLTTGIARRPILHLNRIQFGRHGSNTSCRNLGPTDDLWFCTVSYLLCPYICSFCVVPLNQLHGFLLAGA
jgi:hypothetical protein